MLDGLFRSARLFEHQHPDYSPEIRASDARQHQDRYHEQHKRASHTADGHAIPSQVPRPRPKSIAHEEHPDEDWDREGNESCYRGNRE